MTTYTITLHGGRELSGLTMNGSMFVSKSEITADIFTSDALKTVTISGDGITTTLHNAVCDNILHWDEGWLFNLREPSELERSKALIESLTNDLTNTQLALCDVYEMIGG